MNYTKLSSITFSTGGYPIVLQAASGWDITVEFEPVLYEYTLANGTRSAVTAGYYATITCTYTGTSSVQHANAKQIANNKVLQIVGSSPISLTGSAYVVAFNQEVITSSFATTTIKLKCSNLFSTIP